MTQCIDCKQCVCSSCKLRFTETRGHSLHCPNPDRTLKTRTGKDWQCVRKDGQPSNRELLVKVPELGSNEYQLTCADCGAFLPYWTNNPLGVSRALIERVHREGTLPA